MSRLKSFILSLFLPYIRLSDMCLSLLSYARLSDMCFFLSYTRLSDMFSIKNVLLRLRLSYTRLSDMFSIKNVLLRLRLSYTRLSDMFSIKNVLLRMGPAKARAGGTAFFDEKHSLHIHIRFKPHSLQTTSLLASDYSRNPHTPNESRLLTRSYMSSQAPLPY